MSAESNTRASGRRPSRWLSVNVLGQLAVVAVIVLVGGVVMRMLIAAKFPPPREERAEIGPLVSVHRASVGSVQVNVQGHGTVEPRHALDIVPQVSGRVISVHESLIAGGVVKKGEVLLQIDRADYELALQTAKAQVEQAKAALLQARGGLDQAHAAVRRAETALAMEKAEAAARIAEWRSTRGEAAIPELVAREPQIREREAEIAWAAAQQISAQAAVASAEAGIQTANAAAATAQLNLDRTEIGLDFDGRVLSEQVDAGQFLVAGQPVARLYAVDRLEVVVPLEDSELGWFKIPSGDDSASRASEYERGVPTTISADFAGRKQTWEGRAVRTRGEVDPRTRLVEVVVEVGEAVSRSGERLVPGMFVDVSIAGRVLAEVVKLPRHAVRAGGSVWVVREGVLRIVPVKVERADRTDAFVSEGLVDGDLIVTSQLDVVVEGMKVRVEEAGQTSGESLSGEARGEALR